ncbi:MAG: hypothetical protein AB2L14_18625 [Candidatus Xenobiia bacterium LiM19]
MSDKIAAVSSASSAPSRSASSAKTESASSSKTESTGASKDTGESRAAKADSRVKEPEEHVDVSDEGWEEAREEEEASQNGTQEVDPETGKPKGGETGTNPQQSAETTESAKEAGITLPANFNEMSPTEQYNYLKDVTVGMANGDESQWRTGNDELNLIGIRSWQNGQAGSSEGNKYNDTIYAVRMHDGKPEVYAFNGTVDAGKDPGGTGYGYSGPEGSGFSHVADGSYPIGTFEKRGGGKWGVDTTLGQSGDVRINADFNNDAVIQDNERINKTEGAGWGIYFHPGGKGENVGSWSAGCQVIRPEQYGTFQSLLQQDPNQKFGYTLVDSKNLPPVDANNKAVGIPNTPEVAPGVEGSAFTGENGGLTAAAPTPGGGGTGGTGGNNNVGGGNPDAGYNPGNGNNAVQGQNAASPQAYQTPSNGNPYGATSPMAGIPNITAENVDQQLMMLCMQAIQECMQMQNQGGMQNGVMNSWNTQSNGQNSMIGGIQGMNAGTSQPVMGKSMSMLFLTYTQALMQKMPIQPQTEQMVASTLAMGGIDANQVKQMANTMSNSDQAAQGTVPGMDQAMGAFNQTTNPYGNFI